jgi:hypothetical protein
MFISRYIFYKSLKLWIKAYFFCFLTNAVLALLIFSTE